MEFLVLQQNSVGMNRRSVRVPHCRSKTFGNSGAQLNANWTPKSACCCPAWGKPVMLNSTKAAGHAALEVTRDQASNKTPTLGKATSILAVVQHEQVVCCRMLSSVARHGVSSMPSSSFEQTSAIHSEPDSISGLLCRAQTGIENERSLLCSTPGP